jgi:prepilin-type N-terminal cleavage/methylation domain-containing protein
MNPFRPAPRQVFGRGRRRQGFTMIEIIIVVALLGLFCTMAIPSIYQLSRKTGLRRAISDLRDVCANARARSIFTGKEVTVMFYPLERKFGISGAPAAAAPTAGGGETSAGLGAEVTPGTEVNGIIPEDVSLEMLDVNQSEYKDSDWTRVRFFPNGTCDELTVVYVSEDGEFRKLWLEPTTGLLNQGKMR